MSFSLWLRPLKHRKWRRDIDIVPVGFVVQFHQPFLYPWETGFFGSEEDLEIFDILRPEDVLLCHYQEFVYLCICNHFLAIGGILIREKQVGSENVCRDSTGEEFEVIFEEMKALTYTRLTQ